MNKVEALKARIARAKEKARQMAGTVLQTAEVGGSSFTMAYLRGRMGDENGDLDVAGVPAGLGVGLGLHVLGLSGALGKYGEHAHNIADGTIAEYAAMTGFRLGNESKNEFSSKGVMRRRHVIGRGGLPPGNGHWGGAWGNPATAYARGGVAQY